MNIQMRAIVLLFSVAGIRAAEQEEQKKVIKEKVPTISFITSPDTHNRFERDISIIEAFISGNFKVGLSNQSLQYSHFCKPIVYQESITKIWHSLQFLKQVRISSTFSSLIRVYPYNDQIWSAKESLPLLHQFSIMRYSYFLSLSSRTLGDKHKNYLSIDKKKWNRTLQHIHANLFDLIWQDSKNDVSKVKRRTYFYPTIAQYLRDLHHVSINRDTLWYGFKSQQAAILLEVCNSPLYLPQEFFIMSCPVQHYTTLKEDIQDQILYMKQYARAHYLRESREINYYLVS